MVNKKLLAIVLGVFTLTFLINMISDNLTNSTTEQSIAVNPVVNVGINSPYVGFAENLASIVKKSPDLTIPVDDAVKSTQIMSLYNQLESVSNSVLGTNLPPIKYDENSVKEAIKFTPLLGPYNDLRRASIDLNENNPKSVDNFYLKLASFLGDTVLFSTGGMDLIQKESSTAVITVLKDTKIEEKIVNLCKTDCTKQFNDNTNIFVSNISGQIFPIFSQIHVSLESFKQILNSHFQFEK